MQHVSQLITLQSPESVAQTASRIQVDESSKASSAAREQAVMARLWERMTEIYGHRWISAYGEAVNESWRRGLQGVSVEQIGKGLERLLEQGREWPPTLPEFRALCVTDPSTPLAPYHRPAPRLLEAPRNPEIARAALAECRRILGRNEHPQTEQAT